MDTYVSYALNRIVDTGIGVLAALAVNSIFPGGFTFLWMERLYEKLRKKAPAGELRDGESSASAEL